MPTYSIAQAKNNLPRLVDQAIAGDEVTITRHGKVVVELRAKDAPAPKRISKELLAEIFARAALRGPLKESGADAVRRMRDGEWD